MRFVPDAVGRTIAHQTLLARKNSPTILFGVGVASMVGSTVLACRATLKVEEVLQEIEAEKNQAEQIKHHVDSEAYKGNAVYTDDEVKKDTAVILIRGAWKVTKLYGPSIIVGGVGILCLTKSHKILMQRNAALTAAYVAIDTAFKQYRARVVERYGEQTDRELRYETEEVTVIDEETGKAHDTTIVAPGEPSGYARWFDEENKNWNTPAFAANNWRFLRSQQNAANDLLRWRGHIFLNEVFTLLGMSHTSAGSVVGWMYDRENERGDNYVDFGCWEQFDGVPLEFYGGREGGILLDFNVDGSIWDLIDQSVEKNS